jgi:hypothetical protein
MQREILTAILKSIDGSSASGEIVRCGDDQELTVYVGEPGRAMVVGHVQSIALLATHAEIVARDRGTLCVAVESVCAVQHLQVEAKGKKRSGVGFSG